MKLHFYSVQRDATPAVILQELELIPLRKNL